MQEKPNQGVAMRPGCTNALLVGSAFFGLSWILYIPWRETYMPPDGDSLPLLVDGLLLATDASWTDWFTRGYSDFWDYYPDWSMGSPEASSTAFTRPAFQFLIYIAHFALGKNWGAYQIINCFAVAAMAAMAFYIAQAVLGLRTGLAVVVATLVLLSPPVLDSWLLGVGFAIEPLATLLVVAAFLAALARRDFLCLLFLCLALLMKENTVWAPLAAAITILLRPRPNETFSRLAFASAMMFLPVAMWLGLRFTFFGGIGGTYATAGFTPLVDFLELILHKLTHLHYLLITHKVRQGDLPDRGLALLIVDRATALLVYALLCLWALHIVSVTLNRVRHASQKACWPPIGAVLIVALWATIAAAFFFLIPIRDDRYATSVAVFVWPALVAEVARRGNAIIFVGLAACFALALTRSSYRLMEWTTNPVRNGDYTSMEAVLRQTPENVSQIYVVSAGSLQRANPKYVRLALGTSAEIIRLADIYWACGEESDLAAFDYSISDSIMNLTIMLPPCAKFYLNPIRFYDIPNGLVYRNDEISYELPEATSWRQSGFVGHRISIHIRLAGRVRVVIERGRFRSIAWFDTPAL